MKDKELISKVTINSEKLKEAIRKEEQKLIKKYNFHYLISEEIKHSKKEIKRAERKFREKILLPLIRKYSNER